MEMEYAHVKRKMIRREIKRQKQGVKAREKVRDEEM
jgi:hypothetical protein